MIDEFEALSKKNSGYFKSIVSYYEQYFQLIEKYKDKIQYLLDYEKALREERAQMEERCAEVRKRLLEIGIDPDIADEQISKMKEDLKKSFDTSQKILESFYVDKLACLEENLNEKMKEIYLHGGDVL